MVASCIVYVNTYVDNSTAKQAVKALFPNEDVYYRRCPQTPGTPKYVAVVSAGGRLDPDPLGFSVFPPKSYGKRSLIVKNLRSFCNISVFVEFCRTCEASVIFLYLCQVDFLTRNLECLNLTHSMME